MIGHTALLSGAWDEYSEIRSLTVGTRIVMQYGKIQRHFGNNCSQEHRFRFSTNSF